MGKEIEVISFTPNQQEFSVKELWGSRQLDFPPSSRRVFKALRLTRNEIRARKFESIFFLSGALTLYGISLLVYAKFKGIETLIFFYGKDVLTAKNSFFGSLALWLAPRLANQIAANSRFTAGLLPKRYREKIKILYPSVDPAIVQSVPEVQDIRRPEDRKVILFVGRLVRRKGVDDILRAMKLVRATDVFLEVVGDGPELESLKALAVELGLSDRVSFYGALSGIPLYERYESCKIFAMPSRTEKSDVEGFGTVFLEAGLFGKPSIGTTSGGIPEAVRDGVTGLIVPEGNPRRLSEAITELLDRPGMMKAMGEEAHKRVLAQFTWEKGAQLLVSFLNEKCRTQTD